MVLLWWGVLVVVFVGFGACEIHPDVDPILLSLEEQEEADWERVVEAGSFSTFLLEELIDQPKVGQKVVGGGKPKKRNPPSYSARVKSPSKRSSSPTPVRESSPTKRQENFDQPKLTNSRVLPMDSYINNQRTEYLVTSLEFDQDLYLNEPFVCAGQDLECANSTCVACDWTGEDRSDFNCSDMNCCGPAQWPNLAASTRIDDWCDPSLPPFTKLNFGEYSEKVDLVLEEWTYFRFFVGDDDYCKPISITVHTDFGQTEIVVHNLIAYPDYNTLSEANRQYFRTYYAGLWYRSNGNLNYAQSVVDVCPNVNPAYNKGTYSIAVRGLSAFTRFSIELQVGQDEYPLLPPEDRVLCADVPAEELNSRNTFGGDSLYGGTLCLEEGVTNVRRFTSRDNSLYFELVMPVLPGCREIQFAFNGFTSQRIRSSDADNDVYCFQTSESDSIQTSFIGRSRAIDDTVYFAGCFDEITYVHCTSQSFSSRNTDGMFYWTSRATPRRYKMSELSPGQMAMVTGAGHAGAVAPGLQYETQVNWGFNGLSFITQPTDDPVVFWPPIEPFIYNFTNTPSDLYQQAVKTNVKENMIVVVDLTIRNNQEVRNRDELLANGFIVIPGITNIDGVPVELRNNGEELSNRSITQWMPHQTFETLNVMHDYSSLCDSDAYFRELKLADSLTDEVLRGKTLDQVAAATYESEIFNAALARSACIQAVENRLEEESQTFSHVEINYCGFEFESDDWFEDPCCNIALQSYMCCGPQLIVEDTDLFIGADQDDIDDICFNSDCAESYFSDVSKSLNSRGNPLLGCSSGIRDPTYELSYRIEDEMQRFVRPCLIQAGFGANFQGVPCFNDGDCDEIGYGCSSEFGICHLGSAAEAQDKYFDCYMDDMSSPTEEYIRQSVLDPTDSWFPRDSDYFKKAVREKATRGNCLNPSDPLDLQHSERWVADSPVTCKASGSAGSAYSSPERVHADCPPRDCLGDKTCKYDDIIRCRQAPERCDGYFHAYFDSLEEDCPINETDCNYGDPSDCDGAVCVVCVDGDCNEVDFPVATQEECEALVMCVIPDGTKRYDLTAEECDDIPGECDTMCDAPRCVEAEVNTVPRPGYCWFTSLNETDCRAMGLSWTTFRTTTPFCTSSRFGSAEACEAAGLDSDLPTYWATCSDLTVEECGADTFDDAVYYYLFCAVEDYTPCPTEEECLARGHCSDIEQRSVTFGRTLQKASISYGACYASGRQGISNRIEPFCYWPDSEVAFDVACRYSQSAIRSEEACALLNTTGDESWRRTSWVTPTFTRETCLHEEYGRTGCVLPNSLADRPYFWLEDGACDCMRGTLKNAFEYRDSVWSKPKSYPLQWVEKESSLKYEWSESSLSIVTMEQWVERAIEEFFVVRSKSQSVCENNYLTSSMSTLVCDCFEDDVDGDSCFADNERETLVGLSLVCKGVRSLLKGPPSFTSFSGDSVRDRCVSVTLKMIQQSWFLFPETDAQVSFQFSKKREKGVVLNGNDATVGVVMGDGSKITFKNPDRVEKFEVCLLISGESDSDGYSTYTVPDFGFPQDDYSSIMPLGVEGISERKIESSVYWCAEIRMKDYAREDTDDEDSYVTFFPVMVREDAQDYDQDPYDHQTTSLVYTLAACYLLDVVFIMIYLLVIGKNYLGRGKSVPLVTYIALLFLLVCIFRISFCFVYVDGGFEDNQLAEYIVFEIPTFLLLTSVILAIGLFMRLGKKSTFDFKGADKKLITVGLISCAIVWSLFVIVAVVYSEVILDQESSSICPGRVEVDNSDQEDDARTLSIVYQTIVIFLTLCFALAFLRASVVLFMMTKGRASAAKRFIFRIGSVIVIAFILRCILFLILLALDLTSDIFLFITLFLTECVMMLLIALEFNQRFYNLLATTAFSSVTRTGGSGTSAGGTTGSAVGSPRTDTTSNE